VGAKLFEAIQTCGTTDTGRGWLFLLSGHDVERWMLRSLAIFGVSGNFAIDGALIDQNFVDRLQIVELLEALLRHQRVPRGDGFGGFGVDGFRLYGLPFEPCTVAILDRRTGPADLAIETFVATRQKPHLISDDGAIVFRRWLLPGTVVASRIRCRGTICCPFQTPSCASTNPNRNQSRNRAMEHQ
jgi:hypothetical protein